MGIIETSPLLKPTMADALFPKVRQRVLAVLFGNPGRSFYANEVILNPAVSQPVQAV